MFVGSIATVLAIFSLTAAPAASTATTTVPDWGGIWLRKGGITWDPTLKPGEIDRPPLTPEFQARYQASLDAIAAGRPINDPGAACEPPGGIRAMNAVYPIEIFQRPGLVAVFVEWDSQIRRIYTDGRKPAADMDRTYNGYATGHWEGPELVAETVLLRPNPVITASGLTLGTDVTMRERWRQTDANTLTDTITLVDPEALRQPYTVVKTFQRAPPGFEIMEYVCTENNRNPVLPDGTTGVILNKSLSNRR
jgi:hypothetical protein